MTGAVKLYYSIVPGQLTESRDVNTQLATPSVSFVGADDAFSVLVDGQSLVEINVSLIDDGTPRPTQVFLVNLTRVHLLSTRTDNFAPRLGELNTSITSTFFFSVRRFASAVLAMALCLSVCPSVISRYSVKTAEEIDLDFGTEATLRLFRTVLYVSSKIMVLSSGTLSQTLDLNNFPTTRRPSQVMSTWVNAQCDKLAMVVGRQFITLSVHLCVQHGGCNAVRRADPSAV